MNRIVIAIGPSLLETVGSPRFLKGRAFATGKRIYFRFIHLEKYFQRDVSSCG
jgi:hypothetical protein